MGGVAELDDKAGGRGPFWLRVSKHEFPVDELTIFRGLDDPVANFWPSRNLRCDLKDLVDADSVVPGFRRCSVVLLQLLAFGCYGEQGTYDMA